MDYFVHESSYVDEGCQIGKGTKIWHFSHIMSGCTIGEDCNIGQNVVISPDVVLGRNCKIQNNVSVYTQPACCRQPEGRISSDDSQTWCLHRGKRHYRLWSHAWRILPNRRRFGCHQRCTSLCPHGRQPRTANRMGECPRR